MARARVKIRVRVRVRVGLRARGDAGTFEQGKSGAERLGELELGREIVGGLPLLDLRLDLIARRHLDAVWVGGHRKRRLERCHLSRVNGRVRGRAQVRVRVLLRVWVWVCGPDARVRLRVGVATS